MDSFTVVTIPATSSETSNVPVSRENNYSSRTFCVISQRDDIESAPVDAESSYSSRTFCVIA
ncbi:pheromone-like peptide [Fomitiporia mediterranea MF3/22]|uniref:pheromone-like peptide n=1 Tax=Fomitiporia mediterranea (strain MF3/22) TaxID=694068 RepID=UPI0004407718|nr:pheromone-like peptide [Fomitiporia mediterranea MF3/22]EJC99837.1 pheromone-like peptide [Fomitiporia mediterranea MF3/22]